MNSGLYGLQRPPNASSGLFGSKPRRLIDNVMMDPWSQGIGYTTTTKVVDNSSGGNGVAECFFAPKTGTIDAIWCTFSAISATPVVRVGLEGFSARAPDGTYKAGGAASVDVTAAVYSSTAPVTGYWRVLGTPAFVTQGDKLAATIRWVSGTSATAIYASAGNVVGGNDAGYPSFFTLLTNGTWATPIAGRSALAVRYTDGTIYGSPLVSDGMVSSTGARGDAWFCPIDCVIDRLFIGTVRDTTATSLIIELWEDNNPTPFFSLTVTSSDVFSTTGGGVICIPPFAAKAGSVYRKTIRNPGSATQINPVFRFASAADRDAYGATRHKFTTMGASGQWVDTENSFGSLGFIIRSIGVPMMTAR